MPSIEMTIPTEGEKAPEGHDEKMTEIAEKGTSDSASQDSNTVPALPEGGDERFYNKETGAYNWENHAKDLAYRMSQRDKDKGTETPKPETEEAETPKVPNTKGLDFQSFTNEFMENGELSENSYKALEDAGFSKAMVDTQIAGLKAQMDSITSAAHTAAGGSEEAFNAMVAWARTNLPKAELEAYNKAVTETTNPETVAMAVRGVYAKYTEATGKDPNYVSGNNIADGSAGDVYESQTQMLDDIADPRYKRDSAFRKKVEAKIARSSM